MMQDLEDPCYNPYLQRLPLLVPTEDDCLGVTSLAYVYGLALNRGKKRDLLVTDVLSDV